MLVKCGLHTRCLKCTSQIMQECTSPLNPNNLLEFVYRSSIPRVASKQQSRCIKKQKAGGRKGRRGRIEFGTLIYGSVWSLSLVLLLQWEHPWCCIHKLLICLWRDAQVLCCLHLLSERHRLQNPWIKPSDIIYLYKPVLVESEVQAYLTALLWNWIRVYFWRCAPAKPVCRARQTSGFRFFYFSRSLLLKRLSAIFFAASLRLWNEHRSSPVKLISVLHALSSLPVQSEKWV